MFLRLSLIFLFILIFFSEDCGFSNEFLRMQKMSKDEISKELKQLTLEEKIDLHLESMRFHPSDRRFGIIIAEQEKEKVIYPVIERIKYAKEDYIKVDLISLIGQVCNFQNCMERYPEVIAILENEIAKMNDEGWKKTANRSLSYIKREKVPLPKYPPN